jgi:dihydropteroate synthase-like protein
MATKPRILFVTGKLAEPSLRRVLQDLAPKAGFESEVAVLNITVAALMTTDWIARHLTPPHGIEKIIFPGLCQGEAELIENRFGIPVERGPIDLRDLPEQFGKKAGRPEDYGKFDIEIVAEINNAPRMNREALVKLATEYRDAGADVIDLGCDPGGTWYDIGEVVKELKELGLRISVDSFNPAETLSAVTAGAELVLSINGTNFDHAKRLDEANPRVEVVAIPDTPSDLDSLHRTAEALSKLGIAFRLDPVLEPIGFGFAASLGRYLETRKRHPDAAMMIGIGNLTELTDCDSAGVNVMLAGFCQELGIRSVLTTQVINWSRTSIQEFDLARRLVHHAVTNRVLPKRLEPGLVMLRDPKLFEHGEEAMAELATRLTDKNYRVFAERGEIHILNGSHYLRGSDPFVLFEELTKKDSTIDPSHAFYLGYEFAKAVTALTLGKQYTQDRALHWGFLTIPEKSMRDRH